jgi:transmembrane sensor
MNGDQYSNKEDKELPFEFRKKPVDEQMQQDNWNAVEAAICQPAAIRRPATPAAVRRIPRTKVWMAAASVCLIAIGTWYMVTGRGKPQAVELKTGYGEVKQILLPDSSLVILNANSSIRIQQEWSEEGGRQVWLEGEGYFQVRKKASTGQTFIVHTRQVDVEALGTKFNVNTRREHSVVSLEEGKVRLSVHGSAQTVLDKTGPTILRPGQVMEIDGSYQCRVNNDKDVSAHSGWARNEFHFDNTSLAEVASLIEDTYGYKMEVSDTSLLKLNISGDLRAANVKELVVVLEAALRLSMRIENKVIYVRGM